MDRTSRAFTDFPIFHQFTVPDYKIHPWIGGQHINFLDLSISIHTGKHNFKIFHKPTTTDTLLHGLSYHPPSHKHAALLAMVHCLLSFPLTPHDFQEEISTIKYLARINLISIDVDNLIRKIQTTRTLDPTTTHSRHNSSKEWARLLFLRNLSFKLACTLKQFNIKPTFYCLNTLKNNFVKLKDSVPVHERSGIYNLSCNEYTAVYIGQSGHCLKWRELEHERAVKNKTPDRSNFTQHLLTHHHTFDKTSGVWLLHTQSIRVKKWVLPKTQK